MKKITILISFILAIVTLNAQEKTHQKNGYKKVTGKENQKGQRIGIWKYYNYKNIVYDEIYYKKGKMRKRKRYFKDGELRQKISYDKKEKNTENISYILKLDLLYYKANTNMENA